MKTTIQSSAIVRRTDQRRPKLQFCSKSALLGLAFTAVGLLAASTSSAQLLLSDNFNTDSFNPWTFNDNLAADQGGTLATITYSTSSGNSYEAQHGNGGHMLLTSDGWGGYGGMASPNHNFATDANSANLPLIIQCDMWVEQSADPNNWIGLGLGSGQGQLFYEGAYGFLVRQSAGVHNYRLVISDTAGTGSGFNGIANGALTELFIDNVSQGATTTTLAVDAGYITFREIPSAWSGWSVGNVDNLAVSIAPVPEPSTAALSLLGGLGCFALTLKRRKQA